MVYKKVDQKWVLPPKIIILPVSHCLDFNIGNIKREELSIDNFYVMLRMIDIKSKSIC